MTTDNRTNEPNDEQVEAAAKAIWATRYPESRPDIAEATWAEISGYGAWTPEALDIMTEARAALVAAQGAATPVNSFYTTAERVKNGADSLHVAMQGPCPQPCEHLSAEDARDGRDCREHPCTCPTAPTSDREKLIEEARAVAGPKSLYAHTSVAHLLIRLADALAAVERVQETLSLHNPNGRLVKKVLAALDGAPEPEWEWAVRAPGDDEPFSDVYQTREHLAEQETGIAWGEEQLIRRRKAGPWLPVGGDDE